jgi:uncharacterized metal-binding protein YceD (DUF177 family)
VERTSHRYPAISVPIRGLTNGPRNFELKVSAKKVPDIVPEYVGDLEISGQVVRVGQRYRVNVDVLGLAHLICDRSLEEFDEPVRIHVDCEFVVDAEMASQQVGQIVDPEDVHGLMPDATEIDVTDEVRQELALALPMRRVAPQYRNMELNQLYPLDKDESDTLDERWAALRKLK